MLTNCVIYSFTDNITAEELEAAVSSFKFHPTGPMETTSGGWVGPVYPDELVHTVDNKFIVKFCVEKRLLPSEYVKRKLAERIAAVEAREGTKVKGKRKKEMKEALVAELLPKAFTARKEMMGFIDNKSKLIVVEAGSAKSAEMLIGPLSNSLTTKGLACIEPGTDPINAMTTWLQEDSAPEGFAIEDECELKALTDDKSSVKYTRFDLSRDDVKQHLTEGKVPVKLAMRHNDETNFVLVGNMELKKIQVEAPDAHNPDETEEEKFDAEFALRAGPIVKLAKDMIHALA